MFIASTEWRPLHTRTVRNKYHALIKALQIWALEIPPKSSNFKLAYIIHRCWSTQVDRRIVDALSGRPCCVNIAGPVSPLVALTTITFEILLVLAYHWKWLDDYTLIAYPITVRIAECLPGVRQYLTWFNYVRVYFRYVVDVYADRQEKLVYY